MKKSFSFVSVLSFLFCLNCSGSALITDTESSESSIEKILSVEVTHGSDEDPDALIESFTNNLGITITLEKAGLSWGHFHLISEGEDEECIAGFDEELHAEGIENALDSDVDIVLATGAIADREFCQYDWELTTENSDSPGVEDLPEILGASAYVSGTWTEGLDNGSFAVTITEDLTVSGFFQAEENGEVIDHPFHFHESEEARTLTFVSHPELWFENVDFTESDEELENKISDNIVSAIAQSLSQE